MRIFHLTHLIHLAAILGQLFYSVATGQEVRLNPPESTSSAQVAQQSQVDLTDYFAGSLILMNNGAIEMSEIAQKNSTNEEVKQFAKTMADAHEKLNEKLGQLAPQVAQMITTTGSEHQTGYRGTGGENPSESGVSPLKKLLEIQKKAADNYQVSSSMMLKKYQGQDFDMAYLGMQIGAHTWSLAELKALDSVGDQQFQQIVDDTRSKIEQHLKEAKRLSKKFEDDQKVAGKRASQQP